MFSLLLPYSLSEWTQMTVSPLDENKKPVKGSETPSRDQRQNLACGGENRK